MKVAVCIPCHGDPKRQFASDLCGLLIHTIRTRPEIDIQRAFGSGANIAYLRESLTEVALNSGADWLLWADADQTFPQDAALRLLGHGKPIVGCNISTRIEPCRPTAQSSENIPAQPRQEGLESVARLGLGFCLVSAEVFKATPKPWFNIGIDRSGAAISEDYWFFDRARGAGFEVMLDHGLSREIGHIGEKIYTL